MANYCIEPEPDCNWMMQFYRTCLELLNCQYRPSMPFGQIDPQGEEKLFREAESGGPNSTGQ